VRKEVGRGGGCVAFTGTMWVRDSHREVNTARGMPLPTHAGPHVPTHRHDNVENEPHWGLGKEFVSQLGLGNDGLQQLPGLVKGGTVHLTLRDGNNHTAVKQQWGWGGGRVEGGGGDGCGRRARQARPRTTPRQSGASRG
jgi:hypothetical protein